MNTNATTQAPAGKLHIGLWVAQALLALAFTASGLMKLLTPVAQLAEQMAWVGHVSPFVVMLAGGSEVLGALGLILPSALRIAPKLTPAAAVGLVVVMVAAAALHINIGEPQMIVPNVVLGGLAAFVAWGRLLKQPIQAK